MGGSPESRPQNAPIQLSQAKSAKGAIAELLKGEDFDERVVASFAGVNFGNDEQRRVIQIKAHELKTGMLLAEDAHSGMGVLMAKSSKAPSDQKAKK